MELVLSKSDYLFMACYGAVMVLCLCSLISEKTYVTMGIIIMLITTYAMVKENYKFLYFIPAVITMTWGLKLIINSFNSQGGKPIQKWKLQHISSNSTGIIKESYCTCNESQINNGTR